MTLIEQLAGFYYEYEHWHTERLDRIELAKHHEWKITHGELLTVSDGQMLIGYCEFTKRAGACFVENIFILPKYRNGGASKLIKNRLFKVCSDCKIFFGERNKKNTKYPEAQLRSAHGL